MSVLTNDIKKGDRIRLRNGWQAIMLDNKKGDIRLAKVYGACTESGSVYAWDIMLVLRNGEWVPTKFTDNQQKRHEMHERLGL